ncbi:neurochondrin homolog [Bemisia tabaci]|uniref:neurochondrin homolog n=1 Tax=Bemisia tabaci TaxID=7038 RepID=UPI0008F9B4B1|nr:PREDICTED: neurochondrin homolog [Bemisia tabaci]
MAAIPDSVKKCAAILTAAKNDTEKLAALFMVTKLVKGDCSSAAKKLLFEAIGFTFLKRLLISESVPDDCPAHIYKSVALSVLSAFCSEPELATHPDFLSNVSVFLEIVSQIEDEAEDENLILITEAYECLQNIAAHDAGQKALFDVGAVAKMSEIYSQLSFQTDAALSILVSIVNRFGPAAWGGNTKAFHALVTKIAFDFETDHSERKFELCGVLHALLWNCPESESLAETEELWPGSIYKGLKDILTSKIGKAQRDPALKLASVMVNLLGAEWTIVDPEKPRQFFLLLVQLSSIEVRMQLEDRKMEQVMKDVDLVTSCFLILEVSVAFVAADAIDLEQKEKQQLYTALKGAFSAVVGLLAKISKDTANFSKGSVDNKQKVFVCAMVRVLSAWLAQETSAMRNQVYELLPFMLALANETFYAYRERYLLEKKHADAKTELLEDPDPLSKVDVLRLMLPALCHLTVEDKSRQIMLSLKQEEVLYESFTFHWSIAHYKKPLLPKSERLKARPVDPVLPPKLLEDMKDSRAALISMCNIFMNFTVLEAKTVEESTLFSSLMRFILDNLPELKNSAENLVLHAHLAVLGLLLLKQQSKRVKKNDFTICRYIQSTIRFLWDAYNVDESNDSATLVVAMAYKKHWIELMELWFLGMQTMSAVIAEVPWISDFCLDSGWAQGIIDTLRKVKVGSLPPNIKSAYEDFLCRLIDANQSVASELKKHDALSVCRTHRFMELGKKLFGD